MVATEWLQRGKVATHPMDAFPNYWRALNHLYGPGKGPEVERVKAYIAKNVSLVTAQALLAAHSAEVAYLVSQPVLDMRGNGKDTADAVAAFQSASNANAQLQELFVVIYQVRCNLEHGQKSPSVERDLDLCRCASPIVAGVVEKSVERSHRARS